MDTLYYQYLYAFPDDWETLHQYVYLYDPVTQVQALRRAVPLGWGDNPIGTQVVRGVANRDVELRAFVDGGGDLVVFYSLLTDKSTVPPPPVEIARVPAAALADMEVPSEMFSGGYVAGGYLFLPCRRFDVVDGVDKIEVFVFDTTGGYRQYTLQATNDAATQLINAPQPNSTVFYADGSVRFVLDGWFF